jgi:uncharacterized membrane protein YidH (DUF202 family)
MTPEVQEKIISSIGTDICIGVVCFAVLAAFVYRQNSRDDESGDTKNKRLLLNCVGVISMMVVVIVMFGLARN